MSACGPSDPSTGLRVVLSLPKDEARSPSYFILLMTAAIRPAPRPSARYEWNSRECVFVHKRAS